MPAQLSEIHQQAGLPMGNRPILHRAEWLVPVSSSPVANGGVLVRGGRVLAAGAYEEVKAASPTHPLKVDHGAAALLPGLVNAHTHLELSGLAGRIELPQGSFAQWLRTLLALRPLMTREIFEAGLDRGREQLIASGCCLAGDITNGVCLRPADQHRNCRLPSQGHHRNSFLVTTPQSPALSPQDSAFNFQCFPFQRQVFLEILGFDLRSLDEVLSGDLVGVLEMDPAGGAQPSLAAHSCYATAGMVIRESKEWCRRLGLPFSMHVAEHPEEREFLMQGTGFCRQVLEDLGRWTSGWTPPRTSPVGYLSQLDVLDPATLLVHAVHLNEEDWDLVSKCGCPVCFCPRSNRNLNVGQPDISRALRQGLVVALGTDSLASNSDLSLFAEAAYVVSHYPEISAEVVLKMITLGGARGLGWEQHFGSIQPGRQAQLLAVALPPATSFERLFDVIIEQGNQGAWRWMHHPASG